MHEEEIKRMCGIDPADINMSTPFVVLRKYQDRMVSLQAKKLWKKLRKNHNIEDFINNEIENLYKK